MKRNKCIIIFIFVCSILVACQPNGRIYRDEFPPTVVFYTVDGIQKFVSYVSNNRVYDKGNLNTDFSISTRASDSSVKTIFQNITETRIVQSKQGVQCTSFRGECAWGMLDLFYDINGVKYIFTYDFDSDRVEGPPEQSELKNVSIDSINFDLYKAKDETFRGSFLVSTTTIYVRTVEVNVIVSTDNPENINFDCFEFVKITKNLKE